MNFLKTGAWWPFTKTTPSQDPHPAPKTQMQRPVRDRGSRSSAFTPERRTRKPPGVVKRSQPARRPRVKPDARILEQSKGPRSTPPEIVGPKILDLFETIFLSFCEISQIQTRIKELQNDEVGLHGLHDKMTCHILHIKDNRRLDATERVEIAKAQLSTLEDDIAQGSAEVESLQRDIVAVKNDRDSQWKDFCDQAYEYFNSCLAVDFKADWALDEETCRTLQPIVDQGAMIVHTQNEIGDIERKQFDVKHNRRRTDAGNSSGSLADRLVTVRREKYDGELEQLRVELQQKKNLLEKRKELHSRDRDWACDTIIRELLVQAGRIERNATESAAEFDGFSPGREDARRGDGASFDGQDNPAVESDIGTGDNTSPLSSLDAEQLQNRYLELEGQLDSLREDFNTKQIQYRNIEFYHLVTFTDASHETFNAFMTKQLQRESREIGSVEQELVAVYQRILESGHEVPRIVRSVRTGGISKRSNSGSPKTSHQPRRSTRIATGKWQMGVDPTANRMDPPSQRSLANVGSSRSRTRSATPRRDEEVREYLQRNAREYRKMQEKLRRERGVSPL